jgi:hypothetical protein
MPKRRASMKRTWYLMVLAAMLCMIGAAYATTIDMPDGTVTKTAHDGGAYGYAHSFIVDGDHDFVEGDILAVASVRGIGEADVLVSVPVLQTHTEDHREQAQGRHGEASYDLTVTAKGTTHAYAKGCDDEARVTSAAQIGAFAEISEDHNFNPEAPEGQLHVVDVMEDVYGAAYIKSGIGKEWTEDFFEHDGGINENFQMGRLRDVPEGQFFAWATADGQASYDAELWPGFEGLSRHEVEQNAPWYNGPDEWHDQYANAQGQVDGRTTIEGKVATEGSSIGGFISAIDDFDDFLQVPGVVDNPDMLNTLVNIADTTGTLGDTTWDGYTLDDMGDRHREHYEHRLWDLDEVAMSEIATGSIADTDPFAASGTATFINVAAQNGFNPDAVTYASGTIKDASASSSATVNGYIDAIGSYFPLNHLYADSEQTDVDQAADARTIQEIDEATAHSLLADASLATNFGIVASGSIADTFAGASRTYLVDAADDPNGAKRTWGEAFIGSGRWEANAAGTIPIPLYPSQFASSVSGRLTYLTDPTPSNGMGSGAFLENQKTGPVYANMLLLQAAAGGFGTTNLGVADVMGPKDHTLGSSPLDGAGVRAAMDNLHTYETYYDPDPLTPDTYRTDLPPIAVYKWTDGSNDLQFNGPGFAVPSPANFEPQGSGWGDINFQYYMPSPTQRESLHAFWTVQEHLSSPWF